MPGKLVLPVISAAETLVVMILKWHGHLTGRRAITASEVLKLEEPA